MLVNGRSNQMLSSSCVHEWREFGSRLEEGVYPVFPNRGPVVCTKCGKKRHAYEYKIIERRPIPHYSGSWDFFEDMIVEVLIWE